VFVDVREVLAAVAVNAFLNARLVLVVVLWRCVRPTVELVAVVVGDVRGVEQIDEHVLDTDVADLLDDAVDLQDDLLRGHNLTVALNLLVVLVVSSYV